MPNYKQELNTEQYNVVTHGEGACLVLAGAGSGKTRTIIYRVMYLLEQGVRPEEILLVTFTNKAAREMMERIVETSRRGVSTTRLPWAGTFHHIAFRILKQYAPLLGYKNNFTILDSDDSRDVMKLCLKQEGVDRKARRFPSARVVLSIISFARNSERTIEDVLDEKYPNWLDIADVIGRIAEEYRKRKLSANAMDFDDLLVNLYVLLLKSENVRKKFATQFRYVLVDEYQDTNKIQASIVKLFASVHKNILVVGDDAQSIYSFRAAHIGNILEFEKDFKELAAVNGVSLDLVPKETKGQKLEGSDLDIKVFEKDAELFLLDNRHFDYIDIDPFGSPNPFLASSIARLTRGGVLAITATDTAAFTGTYKSVTRRKYWSSSMYNYMKHNVGLRILIRKVQLLGAQFDKALIPILSYHKGHYYRVFFVNKNTKTACDQVLKQHKYFLYDKKGIDFKVSYDTVWIDGDRRTEEAKVRPGVQVAGPLWSGELCNLDLLRMISHKDMFELEKEFFEGLEREAEFEERNIGTDRKVGFYDMHILASYLKLKEVPKFDEFLAKVKGVRCSFSRMGFYSKLSSCDILEILKNY